MSYSEEGERKMKLCNMLKEKDVGSTGIGAMIVFIAVVLVAGIAASVLIQTSMKLESQAMESGQQTIGEVSGGIAVFDVIGRKNTDLQLIAVTVRTRAGSPNIDLNQTVIMLSDGTAKCLLTYDGDSNANHFASSPSTGNLFATPALANWQDLTESQFGVIVLEDADGSCVRMNPVINSGDKVVISINCGTTPGCFAAEVLERTDVYGQIIPEIGSPGIISFTTPAAYSDTVFDLQ